MISPVRVIAALTLLISLVSTGIAEEPAISYQRIHSLITDQDNRISLRVWDDGRMEIRFPSYTTRAGTYHRDLQDDEMAELHAIFETLQPIDQSRLDQHLDQSRSQTPTHVADADVVHFERRRNDDLEISLRAPAPDVWSRIARDVDELAVMNSAEQALRSWMDQQIARSGE
ncbi:hypothetical protein IC757_14065 [Wenzhouxiangella sp. AB-CW3]|uniref:hypothetical protein n=1 Tax=Wenzhouxiangella sp. AB-CW3 TaxID=2771012 RepID=UPI00168B53A1|nr:hypothetical protein [Wenzhouxiangella sp. AB-CW3]QOC22132.1 hypothetical protein IC757_14065 [Wenzhouxiangella sp. AB-CW3]